MVHRQTTGRTSIHIKIIRVENGLLCKRRESRAVEAHTFNPSTWEAEAGRFLSSRTAKATQKNPVKKKKKKGERGGEPGEKPGEGNGGRA